MAKSNVQQLNTEEKPIPSTLTLEDRTEFLVSKLRMLEDTFGSFTLINNELLLKGDAIHGLEITIKEAADHLQLLSDLRVKGEQDHE